VKCDNCLKKDVCQDYQRFQALKAHLMVAKIVEIECSAFVPAKPEKPAKESKEG